MSYKPLRDLIVIKLDPVDSKTVSSIIEVVVDSIPKSTTGTVVSVGPGIRDRNGVIIPLSVVPSDRIIIGKGSGQRITINKEELLIVREDDIMIILTNK